MVEFRRPDGKMAPGYLAPAPKAGAPGIVLFEEWWGLDDRIKETADRLATQGFSVLVPDLYRGRSAATPDEATHLSAGLDFAGAATQDSSGAAALLRERGAKRVGVMGFCMGGALALVALMRSDAEFDSASVWYGYPPAEAGDPAGIKVPLQGHWALDDGFFTIEGVDDIERKLKGGNVTYEFHRYDAKHGFFNPGELGKGGLGHHHPKHAETAWQRTVDFFTRTLS